MRCVYTQPEKNQLFINMEYKISPEQKEKFTKTVQNFIDFELEMLKQYAASEDSEMSFDETHQVEGVESIKINSIDPETLKIDFSVAENNSNWSNKKGRSTIDDIINLLNYESMYGIQDFREHYLKFLQKTIL